MLGLLAGWLGLSALVVAGGQAALRRWSALRLTLTHDLVERMAGQRTLVAQQPPELWRARGRGGARSIRAGRARAQSTYRPSDELFAARMDRGSGGASGPVVAGRCRAPGAFAVSLGGVLFIYGALRKLAQSSPALGAAALAWQQVAPPFQPRRRGPEPRSSPPPSLIGDRPGRWRAPPHRRPGSSPFGTPGGRRRCSPGAPSSFGAAIGCCSKGPRAAASPPWGRCWPAFDAPDAGQLLLDGVDQRRSASPAGARRSARPRSSTRTTSFSHTLPSTCCSGAPGRPGARTGRGRSGPAQAHLGPLSNGCLPASSSSSAKAAGSSRTASEAASSSPARSCSRSTPAFSTRASRRSIPRRSNGPSLGPAPRRHPDRHPPPVKFRGLRAIPLSGGAVRRSRRGSCRCGRLPTGLRCRGAAIRAATGSTSSRLASGTCPPAAKPSGSPPSASPAPLPLHRRQRDGSSLSSPSHLRKRTDPDALSLISSNREGASSSVRADPIQ